MNAIARTDTSILGRWWWTVDRWTLGALALIIAFGIVLVLAASPPVAERIGADQFYFVRRQLALMPLAILLMVGVSLMPPHVVRRLAVVAFLAALVLLAATLAIGTEIKGARRWINLPGTSLQPSEFVKPSFCVVTAWLLAEWRRGAGFPGHLAALALLLLVLLLLLKQPDLGMAFVVTAVWCAQLFVAGIPLWLVFALVAVGVAGLIGAYHLLGHVASRINRFLDPASGDSYQVDRSIEAFTNGGLWGRGPGEGRVKNVLPDGHADFIFSVAGEELGLIACLIIVALFAFVVLRGMTRLLHESNLFVLLAAGGLLIEFGLQAMINMASALHLMPTKGMTLPFISYGGSSLIALALGTGMMLALTRRRYSLGGYT